MCKGCSESNASCFMVLAHSSRGRYWWYGIRGWTFPPAFCYMLLPCDRWDQRGSLTEWHLSWKCRRSKGMELNYSMCKNGTHWHLSMFAECLWRPNSRCERNEAVGGVLQQWWQKTVGHLCYTLLRVGMQAPVHHWQKCIANRWDYAEA